MIKLTEHDEFLLKNGRFKELSIFLQNVPLKTTGIYKYYEVVDDIYYINMFYGNASFFINKDKKIIYGGRHYDMFQLPKYIPYILEILNSISISDFANAIRLHTLVSCTKWFVTYGHFKDEAFALCDFQNNLNISNNKVLLEYHTDNEIVKNYPVFKNYNTIDNYLFYNSINAYDYRKRVLKTNKLYLMQHYITDESFHAFPIYATTKILNSIPSQLFNFKNIYIGRGKATHLNRNLNNENEIIDALVLKDFTIVNPEIVAYDVFINMVKNADNIVMTWGGAMTNMIYFKPNANVYILKSKSYEHESIELFQKIISTYKLRIVIILHKNNNININTINSITVTI
jgi:hypothetical protein